MAFRLINA